MTNDQSFYAGFLETQPRHTGLETLKAPSLAGSSMLTYEPRNYTHKNSSLNYELPSHTSLTIFIVSSTCFR